jgi:hypothetical protein
VWEIALAGLVGGQPLLGDGGLDAAHGLALGDARVGHAVHVPVQQILLVLGREVAVVRHALVVVVGDEIEDVLLQVRPVQTMAWTLSCRIISASVMPSSAVDIAPASVTSILPPALQVRLVTLGGVEQGRRVEVTVVLRDELGHRALFLG